MSKVDYKNWETPVIERGANGGFLTSSLFYEMAKITDQIPYAKYTMLENEIEVDGVVYPSAYQVILYSNSEYDAAMRLLGSYRHWDRLKESNPVWKDGLDNRATIPLQTALSDMFLRIESLGQNIITTLAGEGNLAAAKHLAGENKKNTKKPTTADKDNSPRRSKSRAEIVALASKFKLSSSTGG